MTPNPVAIFQRNLLGEVTEAYDRTFGALRSAETHPSELPASVVGRLATARDLLFSVRLTLDASDD